MELIWILTVIGNFSLAMILLWRGWYIRYSWLFMACLYSVMCDAIEWYSRTYDSPHYPELWRVILFIALGFNFAIIWESFCNKNMRVCIPVEWQLGIELIAFLAEKAQFLWIAYYIQCFLRVSNLAMIVWFIWIFRGEPFYEPQAQRPEETMP
jgi:hypothetical protein